MNLDYKRTLKIYFGIIATVFIVSAQLGMAQQPQIVELDIIPEEPTTNDEVKLALRLGTWNTSPYQGSTIEYGIDTIWVTSCNIQSQSPSPAAHEDTLSLGYFSAGTYTIDYEAWLSWVWNDCEPSEVQDSIIQFTISEPLGLSDSENESDLTIWPNPSLDGIFFVQISKNITLVDVLGIDGNQQVLLNQVVTESIQINLNNLSPGMYFLRFRSEEGTLVLKRFTRL